MDELKALLEAVGLPGATLPTAIVLAILLRFLRGVLPAVHWAALLSYGIGVGCGFLGAWWEVAPTATRPEFVHTALALACVVLIAQRAAQAGAASNIPLLKLLPNDGQWATSDQGGK